MPPPRSLSLGLSTFTSDLRVQVRVQLADEASIVLVSQCQRDGSGESPRGQAPRHSPRPPVKPRIDQEQPTMQPVLYRELAALVGSLVDQIELCNRLLSEVVDNVQLRAGLISVVAGNDSRNRCNQKVVATVMSVSWNWSICTATAASSGACVRRSLSKSRSCGFNRS